MRELQKYANPRKLRHENYLFRTYGNIMRVANFYEKGGDKQFDTYMDNFVDRDEGYLHRPFDAAGLSNLAKTVAANRKLALIKPKP